MLPTFLPLIVLAILAILILYAGLGINQEYERAVVFRLGRIHGFKGPGLYLLIPWIDRSVKIDIRIRTVQLETQETVTRDGLAIRVNAVLWFRPIAPDKALITTASWYHAVVQAAETALRDAIGQSDLDQLLKDRLTINRRLFELLTQTVEKWGVSVDGVEIKDLDIPEQMQRALAREAEAVRERRARIIKADGEREAAVKLAEAAEIISANPHALELRRLQTLAEIGAEHNSTVVVALPTEAMGVGAALARLAPQTEPNPA